MKTLETSEKWMVGESPQGAVIGTSARGVCIIPSKWNIPPDESEANAKLIAAAPDLLEALQNLLNKDELNQFEAFEVEKKAMAAIKKATE